MTSAAGAQPVVDFHQHFFHPAETGLAKDSGTVTAKELIEYLDAAKIRRALVLSVAYQFGNPNRPPVENEYAKVRAENDWTSQQVSLYPDRLRGFCGVNPLREYAVKEVERCAADTRLRHGLKLHFGNSDVDLDNPEHVAKLTTVFRETDRRGMAIVVHMHASVTRGRPYGARFSPWRRTFSCRSRTFAEQAVMTRRWIRPWAFSSMPSSVMTLEWIASTSISPECSEVSF